MAGRSSRSVGGGTEAGGTACPGPRGTPTGGCLWVRHTLARVDGKLTLLEPKTERSRRTIVLPAVVVEALRTHRTRHKMERLVAGSRWVDSGHVFTTTIGTPIEAGAVTRAFHAALDRAGLRRSRFHDLRHAATTFILAQGFTLEDVKDLLGHSSIVLTSNTYGARGRAATAAGGRGDGRGAGRVTEAAGSAPPRLWLGSTLVHCDRVSLTSDEDPAGRPPDGSATMQASQG